MSQVAAHSSLVGGSTASRVMACPGSVALVAQMPPKPSSKYADEGTLLHDVMSDLLSSDKHIMDFLGRTYNDIELTQDLIDSKIAPAIMALNAIDPEGVMELEVERNVSFGDFIPDAYGSVDVIGKLGNRTIILDWKFGDGVAVEAENNKQLLFYAAAAKRTSATQWAFEGTAELELIIVQPPHLKRWVTTFNHLKQFEFDLALAVQKAQKAGAPLAAGSHCRWCAAKPVCPQMTGAVERALKLSLTALPQDQIGHYLAQADLLEQWITDLRALAFTMLENDTPVPGYKLVAKRAVRQWANEDAAVDMLKKAGVEPYAPTNVLSPAQAEKALKKVKKELPGELVVSVSSGSTLAPMDDPRPAVLNIGKQLTAALSKLS